ncbi:MAG: alkaline phosphatase family protein [Actinomycetota bacterium]|nr:alkaline phosphatase family protein [Actinomycetota bacterium]
MQRVDEVGGPEEAPRRRVLAIGLDAADWDLIEGLIGQGRMPAMSGLRRRGAWCPLDGRDEPYRSEVPWTAFATGRDPMSTGYWSTIDFDPATYRTQARGALVAEPFWALRGRRVVAFDVPHTTLADGVDGVQVTAWGAHSPQYPRASVPAGLLDEIDARFGSHPAFDADSQAGWYHGGYRDGLVEALVVGAGRRADIVAHLASRVPDWDLVVTVFSETHSAGHQFWHGADPAHPLHGRPSTVGAQAQLESVYEAVDAAVGRLVASLAGAPDEGSGDVDVVCFSVHGMRSNASDLPAMFLVPELLQRSELGWGRLCPPPAVVGPDGEGLVVPPGDERPGDLIARWTRPAAADDPRRPARGRDRLAAGVRRRLRRARRSVGRRMGRGPSPWWSMPARVGAEVAMRPGEAPPPESVDYQGPLAHHDAWPHMRAFALPSFSDAHLRVNLAGREANGIVAPDDYRAELDRLEALVRGCRDARTGRPLVDRVYRPRADDPLGPGGPVADLVVVADRPVDAIEHPDIGRIGPVPFLRTGEHDPAGFLVAAGPGIRPDRLAPRPVGDLVPTLLALLGASDAAVAACDGAPIALVADARPGPDAGAASPSPVPSSRS